MTSCIDMNITRETFKKSERLCSRKEITSLFESGNIFHNSIFKVVWEKRTGPSESPALVSFSVSKRGFKHAVTRNLIKRRMREAYRKNKKFLYDHLSSMNIQIVFMVILKGDSVPDYITIEKSIKEIINKLISLSTKSEVGSRKTEAGSRKTEDRNQS